MALIILMWFLNRSRGQRRPGPMTMRLEQFFLDNPVRHRFFNAERLWQLTGPLDGLTVGEIGIGVGVVVEQLARQVGPHGRVWGVDVQSDALTRTQKRLARRRISADVTLKQADASALPWPDAALDWVFLITVYGEIPFHRRALVLQEVRRVLKPGGRLGLLEYWPDPHFQPQARLRKDLQQAHFRVDKATGNRIIYALTAKP